MSAWKDHWPLARRWAFLKPRLLRLRQESHGFQVDFCPLPDIVENEYGFWLGLVIDPGLDLILATSILDEPPIVQNLAGILSDAMQCPLPGVCFRPEIVLLRDNPEWDQLFPLLGQVGIEGVVTEDLMSWDAKAGELIEWLKDRWSARTHVAMKRKDELTVSETLLELRIRAQEFLFFEQSKYE
jgi:hypothetical protein